MWKFYLLVAFAFSGCSNITINATMCDQIASDPTATMPQECRNYNEDEAQKAFDNTKHNQIIADDDIKFTKDDKEEK